MSSMDKDPVKQTAPPEEYSLRNEIIKERDIPNAPESQAQPNERKSHLKKSSTTENLNPKTTSQAPTAKGFNISESEEEYNQMIEGMIKCGMKSSDAEANLKTRKTAFNKAYVNTIEIINPWQ